MPIPLLQSLSGRRHIRRIIHYCVTLKTSRKRNRISVFVRSRKVPFVITDDNVSQVVTLGSSVMLINSTQRALRYQYILDAEQERLLSSVHEFAQKYDAEVEVKDLTKQNVLERAFRTLSGQKVDGVSATAAERLLN